MYHADEFENKVRITAGETGFNITAEQVDVILTFIDHDQGSCQGSDCHAVAPQMLIGR